jgi:hypothetical protein
MGSKMRRSLHGSTEADGHLERSQNWCASAVLEERDMAGLFGRADALRRTMEGDFCVLQVRFRCDWQGSWVGGKVKWDRDS